jgi:hypothetical protein
MSLSVDNTIDLKPYVEQLNNCTDKWFKENFPYEYQHGEFKPCCTNEETEALAKSINVLKTHNSKYTDEEIAKGIIVYYYISIVLPYYMAHQADEKFVSATTANEALKGFYSFIVFGTDNIHNYVIDNDGVVYEIYKKLVNIDGKDYLQIEDTETIEMFFMDSEGKIFKKTKDYNNSMVYTTKLVKKPKNYFDCFDKLFKSTPNSRRIVDMITISDSEWASYIRRTLMNFNSEPFQNGGKNRKTKIQMKRKNSRNKTKRTKRTKRNGRKGKERKSRKSI